MIGSPALDSGLASDSRSLCHADSYFSQEFFVVGLSGYLGDRPRAKNPVPLSTMNILITAYLGTDYISFNHMRQEF